MAILVDASTKVICQGITGQSGKFHTDQKFMPNTCLARVATLVP